MKVLLITLLFAYLAMCSSEIQEVEAELDLAYQVEPAEDVFDYYLNYLKGFFISTEENGKYPLYKQCDSRWKNNKISSKTICQVGCLMSSVSMALAGNGYKVGGQTATPATLNSWLRSHHGYSGNLFVWGAVKSLHLCYVNKYRGSAIDKYVKDSHYEVVLNVHSGGHWVLATGHCSGGWSVNDPGYSTTCYKTSQVTQAAVFKRC